MNIQFSTTFFDNQMDAHLCPFNIDFLLIKNLKIEPGLLELIDSIKVDAKTNIELNKKQILENMEIFKKYFEDRNADFPLIKQYETVLKKGFKKINPLIDLLLISELSTGILAGVQDLNKIEGDLEVDLSIGNETFIGMQSKEITCNKNELVLRDSKTIIASFLKGPDLKTMISTQTTEVIIFSFAIPGLETGSNSSVLNIFEAALKNYAQIQKFNLRS
jgi:phenylalanyl-tRNA synthetase beta subunit